MNREVEEMPKYNGQEAFELAEKLGKWSDFLYDLTREGAEVSNDELLSTTEEIRDYLIRERHVLIAKLAEVQL